MRKKTPDTPLIHARRTRLMNQSVLAQLAGVCQQTISKAERGLISLHPTVEIRIATVLGVPREELFPVAAIEPDRISA